MGLRFVLITVILIISLAAGACSGSNTYNLSDTGYIMSNDDTYSSASDQTDVELKDDQEEVMLFEEDINNRYEVVIEVPTPYGCELSDIETLMNKAAGLAAGSSLGQLDYTDEELKRLFYINNISQEIKDRINGLSYGENCEVPYEELRYLRVLHMGFDGKTYVGELIVNKAIASDIIDIFIELYQASYPIERMVLVDEYQANDILSMEANNSSAFNYRYIEGTKKLSKHSYGMAIDINPLYNPYITKLEGELRVLPDEAKVHVDRTQDNDYYIREGDICYKAFIDRGFMWGGDWRSQKDYQHFQKDIIR